MFNFLEIEKWGAKIDAFVTEALPLLNLIPALHARLAAIEKVVGIGAAVAETAAATVAAATGTPPQPIAASVPPVQPGEPAAPAPLPIPPPQG